MAYGTAVVTVMKCTVPLRPKPVVTPAPPIPLELEAAALYLAEVMPPSTRRDLGRLLLAG